MSKRDEAILKAADFALRNPGVRVVLLGAVQLVMKSEIPDVPSAEEVIIAENKQWTVIDELVDSNTGSSLPDE